MKPALQVTKSSGLSADFDVAKLRLSLHKSGAAPETADQIVAEIQRNLFEGVTTKDIYGWAFRLLRQKARPAAARYSLKQAMLQMGPTGFPFEAFISRLLQFEGWKTQVGLILEGHCVRHELDVLGEKDDQILIAECKYHNHRQKVSDVKISLYIHARFHDLERRWKETGEFAGKTVQGWIFTNTRFTDDAAQYGACSNLRLVSWNMPPGQGLKDWVDRSGLHPLSCLTALTRTEKQHLMEHGIVLVKDLLEHPQALEQIRLSQTRAANALQEAQAVVSGKIPA